MKRKWLILLSIVLVMMLNSCNSDTIKVSFYDYNHKIIKTDVIKKNNDINFPKINSVEEGFYYIWDKSEDDIKNGGKKIDVIAVLKECDKIVRYYIDENIVYETTEKYSTPVYLPDDLISPQYDNTSWYEEITVKDNIYYFTYRLNYSMKYVSATFLNDKDQILDIITVKYGEKVSIPEFRVKKGTYYKWNIDLSILDSLKESVTIKGNLEEYDKTCNFYIDNELVKSETTKYFTDISYPNLPNNVKTFKWVSSESFENDHYIFEFVLNYTLKGGAIYYFDGDNKVELSPSSYITGEEVLLPIYEKEGYAFLGWFASDISLYRYTKVPSNSDGNLFLYARFVKTSDFVQLTLPNSSYHFVDIVKVSSGNNFVYQPRFPNDIPTTSVTSYEWSTSDNSVASVSAYSSLSGLKTGYCILKAVSKDDPTIIVTAIIKVTSDGIFLSSQEEANNHQFCEVTFIGKNDEVILKQVVEKGGNVIPPTPPHYDGYAFMGWNHELYNINENLTIMATYEKGDNQYIGKKIAIIGDSISTYKGYIPDGYSYFYPYPVADLFDVNQTWWMQVINRLGGGLFVNNSYSGTCVSTGKFGTNTDERLKSTIINEEKPDIIIIYMGSNDCASKYVGVNDFRAQYKIMIQKLQKLCPDACIMVCTLAKSKFYSENDQALYNQVISDYASEYNLKLLDIANADISDHLVDSAHPKKSGMSIIANAIINAIFEEKNHKKSDS